MTTRKNHLTTLLLGFSLIGTLHAGTRLSCQGGGDVKIFLRNGEEIRTSYHKVSDPYIRLFAGKSFRFDMHSVEDGSLIATVDGRRFRFIDKGMGRVTDRYGMIIYGLGSEEDPREIRLVQDLQSGQWSGEVINDTLQVYYPFRCRVR